jgi:hypothetical protein
LDHSGLSFSSFEQIFAELFSLLSLLCPANKIIYMDKIQKLKFNENEENVDGGSVSLP